ncbi:hypothetical protein FJQ54_09395 [Sandaracinobacter neustonicus]|uniref:Uncharacterized protein n=1 Tax=Sandaracinobacter neustonicus TaxID=1715348 RepID=A0A501XKK1_9SPHN|nr:hypothetical protein [Sandaracinobacter neustonicus]TPE61100.1 hypothetical protein FJQ54_09395 [Sandaracinobacter neustonicus]
MRLLLSLLLLLLPTPLLAQWKMAETERFRVYADMPARKLEQRAALLEDFHALLVRATGRDLPPGSPPLDVFLVSDMAQASPWRPVDPRVSGFYRASSGRISAFAMEDLPDSRIPDLAQTLLLHEYAHHFLLGASRNAYPAWYVEGFAEYYSTARFGNDSIDYGLASPVRAQTLVRAPWIPLERLLARDPSLLRGDDSAIFYAQSWLLTHYLFRAPGMRGRLSDYLKAYAAGADPVEAFRTHIDPDFRAFEAKLRRYVVREATYSRFNRIDETRPTVRITELPASASTMLMPMIAIEQGVPPDRREEALADLRQRAARFPGDPLALRALALGELQLGSPMAAADLLDAQLARTPDDADLLRWRAQAARLLGQPEVARTYLLRAMRANPQDWRTALAYSRLYRSTAQPMPDQALEALMKAYRLAPQVNDVVLDAALALANAGRTGEAAQVLEPLAWAPHGGPASELAQRMLVKARAGDVAGVQGQVEDLRRQQIAGGQIGRRR